MAGVIGLILLVLILALWVRFIYWSILIILFGMAYAVGGSLWAFLFLVFLILLKIVDSF